MISTSNNSAHVELSEHLHRSISAMTSDELKALTDALAAVFLEVDDVARITRHLLQRGHASDEPQEEEPELCLLCEQPMLLTSFGDPDEEPVWHCFDCYGEGSADDQAS